MFPHSCLSWALEGQCRYGGKHKTHVPPYGFLSHYRVESCHSPEEEHRPIFTTGRAGTGWVEGISDFHLSNAGWVSIGTEITATAHPPLFPRTEQKHFSSFSSLSNSVPSLPLSRSFILPLLLWKLLQTALRGLRGCVCDLWPPEFVPLPLQSKSCQRSTSK